MTPDHYEALLETVEVLADREIMAALGRSADDFEKKRTFTDEQVWKGP